MFFFGHFSLQNAPVLLPRAAPAQTLAPPEKTFPLLSVAPMLKVLGVADGGDVTLARLGQRECNSFACGGRGGAPWSRWRRRSPSLTKHIISRATTVGRSWWWSGSREPPKSVIYAVQVANMRRRSCCCDSDMGVGSTGLSSFVARCLPASVDCGQTVRCLRFEQRCSSLLFSKRYAFWSCSQRFCLIGAWRY
jgi:hypothetical protein